MFQWLLSPYLAACVDTAQVVNVPVELVTQLERSSAFSLSPTVV